MKAINFVLCLGSVFSYTLCIKCILIRDLRTTVGHINNYYSLYSNYKLPCSNL